MLKWPVTLCPVAFLCFLQYVWWLNTRMRPDQTASTLWTTNSSCTTRQTTLTTGASSATSAGNLMIACWSDRVERLEKCLRGMQIQDCPSLPTTHGVVTSIMIPPNWKWPFLLWSSCIPQTASTTCEFGQKSGAFLLRHTRLAGTEEFLSCHPALGDYNRGVCLLFLFSYVLLPPPCVLFCEIFKALKSCYQTESWISEYGLFMLQLYSNVLKWSDPATYIFGY